MILLIVTITGIISYLGFTRPDIVNKMALWPYRIVEYREWYRLFTHMFVHGGWTHLLVNMLVFYSFGEAVLWQVGHLQMGILYFGGGVASALISTTLRKNAPYYLSIGASAGVSSLIFASICFEPWSPIYFFGILPIPGILLGIGYLIYSYHMGKQSGQQIDHMAHFYGAVFGLLYPMLTIRGAFYAFVNSLLHGSWF